MSRPGSHDHAAAIAARRGLEAGLTRLGIALLSHVASRGVNFQTDSQVQDEIRRPDGRRYHRESIGRKRRELARAGILSARRFFPGQRPTGAKCRTGHGCVASAVVWAALRVTAPILRGAKQAERRERKKLERATAPEVIPADELAELSRAFLQELGGPPRPKPPPG